MRLQAIFRSSTRRRILRVAKGAIEKKGELAFFDVLLKEIDREIRGGVCDNDLVKFLSSRLLEDLKNVPQLKHIFKLTPEQRHVKLLEILRHKLIIR